MIKRAKNKDGFCPLTGKPCRSDCMLLIDGMQCAIRTVASEMFVISDYMLQASDGEQAPEKAEVNKE